MSAMTSTRHAIVALVLPFLLGAGLLFNLASERWVFAGLLFLALLGFVGFEYRRWVSRDRAARRIYSEAEHAETGPILFDYAHDRDRYFGDLERKNRRWAG